MTDRKPKILLAHPGRQHSFRLAAVMQKYGILHSYVTTVYNKDKSIMMKLLKYFLSKKNIERAENRKMNEVPDNKVVLFNQINGLIILLLLRIDKTKRIYTWFNDYSKKSFEIKLAKYAIKNDVDAVVCYSGHGFYCFSYLHEKAPYIYRIIDVPSANKNYLKSVYEKDFTLSRKTRKQLFKEVPFIWSIEYMNRYNFENTLAQKFIVPSDFVKKSFIYDGINENNICIIPYGSNFKKSENIKKDINKKLNLIYVGNVTQIKGISYLFEALLNFPENLVELNVYGQYNKRSTLYKDYSHRVNFQGFVTKTEIGVALEKADVFVFSSLGEGMSLSILEAMSHSLPVIVTENSGVSEYIENGKNGFIIKIQNSKELEEKISWFLENRDKMEMMRKYAYGASQKLTWDIYSDNVIKFFKNTLYYES